LIEIDEAGKCLRFSSCFESTAADAQHVKKLGLAILFKSGQLSRLSAQ
jgi:hypothetical protein